MSRTTYLVKRRSLRAGRPNPYNHRNLKRGKWETVERADDFQHAAHVLRERSRVGLYEWAVFHQGKRVV